MTPDQQLTARVEALAQLVLRVGREIPEFRKVLTGPFLAVIEGTAGRVEGERGEDAAA